MKAWLAREAWLSQRDRIDRENIEIIASESRSTYINRMHLFVYLAHILYSVVFERLRARPGNIVRICAKTKVVALTRIEEHDGFETREFRVVDLDLVQRLHQLLHHPDAHLAHVQILLIGPLCGLQRYHW